MSTPRSSLFIKANENKHELESHVHITPQNRIMKTHKWKMDLNHTKICSTNRNSYPGERPQTVFNRTNLRWIGELPQSEARTWEHTSVICERARGRAYVRAHRPVAKTTCENTHMRAHAHMRGHMSKHTGETWWDCIHGNTHNMKTHIHTASRSKPPARKLCVCLSWSVGLHRGKHTGCK